MSHQGTWQRNWRGERWENGKMKAFSQDARQRILKAIDAVQSQVEAAKTFMASVATIKRYLKQQREMGNVVPKAIPG